jgi:hypothetical protein
MSEEEQTMTIHEYLLKAIQDDARRAGERDRLLLEARRAGSKNVAFDAVIEGPGGDRSFRLGGWLGRFGNRPRLPKLALGVRNCLRSLSLGRPPGEPLLSSRWQERDHSDEDGATTFHGPGTRSNAPVTRFEIGVRQRVVQHTVGQRGPGQAAAGTGGTRSTPSR